MPAVSIPLVHGHERTQKETRTELKTRPRFSPFSWRSLWARSTRLVSNLSTIPTPQSRTRAQRNGMNTQLHHARRPGRYRHTFHSAGSSKLLLNNRSLIDRRRMQCHSAGATVINTSSVLYTLRGIIVLLAPIPPRCSEHVSKCFLSRMLLATQRSPRGTKHKNNWLIRGVNISTHNMAGTHSVERQSHSAHRWMDGRDSVCGGAERSTLVCSVWNLLQRWGDKTTLEDKMEEIC